MIAPDRAELLARARRAGHDPLDLSLGIPPEPAALDPAGAAADVGAYPPCRGELALRDAVAVMSRRDLGIEVDPEHVAACAGLKEFVATTPLLMARRAAAGRRPAPDTVLLPALCYPPYPHGVALAGLREHRVPAGPDGAMRLDEVPEAVAARALMLWVTSPGNPTGVVEDVGAAVAWGRARGVPVFVDEAYVDLVRTGRPLPALRHGPDGVVAAQSLSKSFGHPGARIGWFAGDPGIVADLVALRRATGLIAAASSQAHAAAVLTADGAGEARAARRARVGERLEALAAALRAAGLPCPLPDGGMFAWVRAPGCGDAFARRLADVTGVVVAPGRAFGPTGRDHVRLAALPRAHDLAARLVPAAARLLRGDHTDTEVHR